MNGETTIDSAIKNINLWHNFKKNYEDIINNFYKSHSALTSAVNTTLKFCRGEIKHDNFISTAKEALSIPLDLVKCLLFFGIGTILAANSVNAAIEDIEFILIKGGQVLLEGNQLFSSPEYLQHKINDVTGLRLKMDFAANLTNTYNTTYDIANSLTNISKIAISKDISYASVADILKSTGNLLSSVVTLNEVYSDINSLCSEGIGKCLPHLVDTIDNPSIQLHDM
jgi:hypothetical protein